MKVSLEHAPGADSLRDPLPVNHDLSAVPATTGAGNTDNGLTKALGALPAAGGGTAASPARSKVNLEPP